VTRDLTTPLSVTGSFKMEATDDGGYNYKKHRRQQRRNRRKNRRKIKCKGGVCWKQ
tara:strand:+ start:517 stop:684 length:168 start_codon:yes stop_codon:yes gene_type:complete